MLPCTMFPLLGGVCALHEDSSVYGLMNSLAGTEEKVLSSWSSIYNKEQSSIFIFKCKKQKSYIYGCVDMCVFLIEKTPLILGFAKFK